MDKNSKLNKGISVIEILIVIAVIAIALTSLLGVISYSIRISNLIRETTQANATAQEVMEAVRNFRDGTTWNTNGLGSLATGVAYYPKKSADIPAKWTLVRGEEIINGFKRKVIFNEVQRDASDNIVETGGTNDPNAKKVTVFVSWQDKEVKIITYLTNWK